MSHYSLIVVLPPGRIDTIESELSDVLRPFDENEGEYDEHAEAYSDGVERWWDWWQIGGRWTGHFDGYDPESDPANQETCKLCAGTGKRDWSRCDVTPEWIAECNGCNGCKGTGRHTTWPTQWGVRRGDIVTPAEALTRLADDDDLPFRMLAGEVMSAHETRNPDWKQADGWETYFLNNDSHAATCRGILNNSHPDCRVVIVDYHC